MVDERHLNSPDDVVASVGQGSLSHWTRWAKAMQANGAAGIVQMLFTRVENSWNIQLIVILIALTPVVNLPLERVPGDIGQKRSLPAVCHWTLGLASLLAQLVN
jgi:hypothetical protein